MHLLNCGPPRGKGLLLYLIILNIVKNAFHDLNAVLDFLLPRGAAEAVWRIIRKIFTMINGFCPFDMADWVVLLYLQIVDILSWTLSCNIPSI